jgi:DNA-binding HxlR family transcriptional regulator
MTCDPTKNDLESRKLNRSSLWLSKKMIRDGCTLQQTLQVMKERCKECEPISPMSCVEECETWKVKKELQDVNNVISSKNHDLKLINAVKNKRRIAILEALGERPILLQDLQKKLGKKGFHHSQKTLAQYLAPLINTGLVQNSGKRLKLTLYGGKIRDTLAKHNHEGRLPIHSSGYEEKVLRDLLEGPKTRRELLKKVPLKSLSRTLKRLKDNNLVMNNSNSNQVNYFRTKRSLSLESLSPTQRRMCEAIPDAGTPARSLSKTIGINLRRTYKYLRSLRGKKLVFRRNIRNDYHLTEEGHRIARLLVEIAEIR